MLSCKPLTKMIPEISANVATFNKLNALQNPYNIKVARHFVSLGG
jgi:hypothetical protein